MAAAGAAKGGVLLPALEWLQQQQQQQQQQQHKQQHLAAYCKSVARVVLTIVRKSASSSWPPQL